MTLFLWKGTAERFARDSTEIQAGLCRMVETRGLFSFVAGAAAKDTMPVTLPVSGQDYNGSAGAKLPRDFPVPALKEVCEGLAWCFSLQLLLAQLTSHSTIYLATVGNYFTVF